MGFLGLRRLGKKDSVNDYQGVLVPVANATRHPTVAAEYARRRSAEGRSDNNDTSTYGVNKKVEDGSPKEGHGSESEDGLSPYTIEGLRAEVLEDVAASGHDSAYDREYKG